LISFLDWRQIFSGTPPPQRGTFACTLDIHQLRKIVMISVGILGLLNIIQNTRFPNTSKTCVSAKGLWCSLVLFKSLDTSQNIYFLAGVLQGSGLLLTALPWTSRQNISLPNQVVTTLSRPKNCNTFLSKLPWQLEDLHLTHLVVNENVL